MQLSKGWPYLATAIGTAYMNIVFHLLQSEV